MMKTDNQTLARALRILANDIQSPDNVPALTLREAADRIEELSGMVEKIQRELTSALAAVAEYRNAPPDVAMERLKKKLKEALEPSPSVQK